LTVTHASPLSKRSPEGTARGGTKKSDAAKKVGAVIAKICKSKGIEKVVFDRNGFIYHGRVKRSSLEAAREAGLEVLSPGV
jgi:large subunit ribosomal protein L18